jgi:POT family proton-dependent oligopeptide transporter
LLSGVFAALWTKLGDRQPTTPVKFGVGAIVMGVAFWLFLPIHDAAPHSAPLLALVGILFVFTVGELFISPISLSVTTKLAPNVFRTQMVAVLFLSIALGTALSGELSSYYDEKNPALNVGYFAYSGAVAIVLGIILILMRKKVLKLMEGVR